MRGVSPAGCGVSIFSRFPRRPPPWVSRLPGLSHRGGRHSICGRLRSGSWAPPTKPVSLLASASRYQLPALGKLRFGTT